jgi:hypothetical protein
MASNSRLPRMLQIPMLYIVLVGFTSTKNGFMRSGVWQCGQSRSSAGVRMATFDVIEAPMFYSF